MTEMLGPIYHAVSGKGPLPLVKLVEIRNLEMLGEMERWGLRVARAKSSFGITEDHI